MGGAPKNPAQEPLFGVDCQTIRLPLHRCIRWEKNVVESECRPLSGALSLSLSPPRAGAGGAERGLVPLGGGARAGAEGAVGALAGNESSATDTTGLSSTSCSLLRSSSRVSVMRGSTDLRSLTHQHKQELDQSQDPKDAI